MLLRALLAFLALPGLVAFVVPVALALRDAGREPFRWIALVPLVAGIVLLAWCVRECYVAGRGTLAPWEPPRRLVTSGPYRWSRNPMYLAVPLIILGWALGFQSRPLLWYAAFMAVVLIVRVSTFEEPWAARTFREEWKTYRTRVPRWLFRSRRAVVLFWAALIVALPIAGLIYEAYAEARAAQESPAPGTLVDVGGRRLHLLCIGEGEPIVFFEPAASGTAVSSAREREVLASRTTVCSYDRSGTGWSDPGPASVSIAGLARDLAVLQDRARLRAPYVLVGSGVGRAVAYVFAREYPERVAGVVLTGAEREPVLDEIAGGSGTLCTMRVLAGFGVDDLLESPPRPWAHQCAMRRGLEQSRRELAAAPAFPASMPSAVVAANEPDAVVDAVFEILDR